MTHAASFAPPEETPRPLVVVVDDEPQLRKLMGAALEGHYRVLLAEDGARALRLFGGEGVEGIAAVVTDIRMPGMDGLALAAAIRERGIEVPILFVSGYAVIGQAPGPTLSKPFSPDDLLAAVQQLLESAADSGHVPRSGRRGATCPRAMKRVLFLNHAGDPGGAELPPCSTSLGGSRDTSTVVLFADGAFRHRLEAEGVRVELVRTRWALEGVRQRTTLPSPRRLAEVAKTARVVSRLAGSHDVLYANSRKALIVVAAAGALTRRPVLLHLHDLFDLDHFSRCNIALDVHLANWFTGRILANSDATAEAFRRWGGHPKVHVQPCGIDVSVLRAGRPRRSRGGTARDRPRHGSDYRSVRPADAMEGTARHDRCAAHDAGGPRAGRRRGPAGARRLR